MSRLLLAQQGLTNPSLSGMAGIDPGDAIDSGARGSAILGYYIALVIQTAMVLGGLALLLYMFLGAIGWITAGGDSGKIEKARNRIVQSIVGMAVLFSIVAVATFLSPLFGFDLLSPVFINQLQ